MTWDDPQIHTIKEFLTDERDAIIDLLTELNKKAEIDVAEITKLSHVIDYLNERLAGKYQ
tara:strand:- start:490 stop:669 length:180 start_codon:yes stop_codon:yes gene_type:complete